MSRGGQMTISALPTMTSISTGPNIRLSNDIGRLSPIKNTSSSPIATGSWSGVFHDASEVDRGLHTGHHQSYVVIDHHSIAVIDHFREVVAGIDVHHRERQSARTERLGRQMEQNGRVLATREEKNRRLALSGYFADDLDRFVFELPDPGDDEVAHFSPPMCRPHSVLAWPDQRPARLSSPGATGRVHGQQPMDG